MGVYKIWKKYILSVLFEALKKLFVLATVKSIQWFLYFTAEFLSS